MLIVSFGQSIQAQTEDSMNPSEAEAASAIATSMDDETSATKATIHAEAVAIENADRILHRENRIAVSKPLRWRTLRRSTIEAHQITGKAEWLTFSGHKFLGTIELQSNSNWNVILSGGVSALKLEQFLGRTHDFTKQSPLWRLRSDFTPWRATTFRFDGGSDFAYVGWLDSSAHGQIVNVQNALVEFDTFAVTDWQFRANARRSFQTDGNEQTVFDYLALREIVSTPFKLRAGLGAGSTDFKIQTPAYWSPAHVENYGLRLIAAKAFLRYWDVETRLNYGFHVERNREREKESTVEGRVSYRHPSGKIASLNGAFLDVNNGAWWKNDLNFNFEVPF